MHFTGTAPSFICAFVNVRVIARVVVRSIGFYPSIDLEEEQVDPISTSTVSGSSIGKMRCKSLISPLFFSYVENCMADLMSSARELLKDARSSPACTEVYEQICIIHGYVLGMILPLVRHCERPDPLHLARDLANFDKIDQVFKSTRALLQRNATNVRRVPLLSTIRNSLGQLVEMIQVRFLEYLHRRKEFVSRSIGASISLPDDCRDHCWSAKRDENSHGEVMEEKSTRITSLLRSVCSMRTGHWFFFQVNRSFVNNLIDWYGSPKPSVHPHCTNSFYHRLRK